MADFITLTNAHKDTGVRFETPIRIRPEHIVGYASGVGGKNYIVGGGESTLRQGTYVDTTAGEGTYFVTETPEQIDAMLGVTDSAKMRAALDALVGWAFAEHGANWDSVTTPGPVVDACYVLSGAKSGAGA